MRSNSKGPKGKRVFGFHSPNTVVVVGAVALGMTGLLAGCGSSSDSSSSDSSGKKFKIALVQSYSGNDWQNASANLIEATAKTAPYSDDVEFSRQIAGDDPQKQSKVITDEVGAGADALILYPISPSAINPAIKKACDAGVIVVNYDSWTTEPCSFNVHVDVQKLGAARASWLAKELGGNGQIGLINGVAGTAFDTIHQEAVDKELKKYPGIEVVAEEDGFWSQPGARDAAAKMVAAHPDLSGLVAQIGCWGATEKLQTLGKAPIPCAGDTSTGHLRMMLPKGTSGEPTAIGLPSLAASETTFTGALAFLQAYNMLKGGKDAQAQRCNETIIDPIIYTDKDLKVGDDPKRIGNVYATDHVPGVPPGFFANFYSPLVGQGLNASLSGASDQISKPEAPMKVSGDKVIDGVATGTSGCLVP